MLEEELGRFFGGYLVHYGPSAQTPPSAPQVQRNVRLGAPLPGVEIVCEEQAWPLSEHAADVVVMQHGLDFCLSPHGLLREAASSVRPGGHLLIIGINPWSSWGLRHVFAHDALRKARCISPSRVADWLNLLGFALEKRRFGCYRPPLASPAWQTRLAGWERMAGRWQLSGGGFYLLVARKISGRPATLASGAPRTDGQVDSIAHGQGQPSSYRTVIHLVFPGRGCPGLGRCRSTIGEPPHFLDRLA